MFSKPVFSLQIGFGIATILEFMTSGHSDWLWKLFLFFVLFTIYNTIVELKSFNKNK